MKNIAIGDLVYAVETADLKGRTLAVEDFFKSIEDLVSVRDTNTQEFFQVRREELRHNPTVVE